MGSEVGYQLTASFPAMEFLGGPHPLHGSPANVGLGEGLWSLSVGSHSMGPEAELSPLPQRNASAQICLDMGCKTLEGVDIWVL